MYIPLRERYGDTRCTEFPVNRDIQVMGDVNHPVDLTYKATQFKFQRTVSEPSEQRLRRGYSRLLHQHALMFSGDTHQDCYDLRYIRTIGDSYGDNDPPPWVPQHQVGYLVGDQF